MEKAVLKITEATGKSWEMKLRPDNRYSIGRAQENDIILNDRRVSRRHAQIIAENGHFKVIDGYFVGESIKPSVNHVFINGNQELEKILAPGDKIIIGTSELIFENLSEMISPIFENFDTEYSAGKKQPSRELPEVSAKEVQTNVMYEDQPLGHTQVVMSAKDIMGPKSLFADDAPASAEEIKILRRKAQILEMLYEMSKTLGTVFDLKAIFEQATNLIFRGTPADRVVALLADETVDGKILDYSLYQIAFKARNEKVEKLTEKLAVSRTITQKVMREKVAVLSQDAKTDEQFAGAESIVSQGVRSTICAPLITESNVHGVVYADRLDPFASFSADDLELISAVAAQTAVTVETIKSHEKLAREEVARANYSRFMPEYVVKQLLENPNSFKLGGVNQQITVLFADIRGFTSLSETEQPEKVVGLLNLYFTAMSEIIFKHGGTLDKYIGDGLMAIFGAPTATKQDADNALQTAIEMMQRLETLNSELKTAGYGSVEIGIGLHTGIATVGYIGSEQRSEYTAIGDTVNLAARLESNSKSGQILISEATAKAAEKTYSIAPQPALTVKNRTQPVTLFELKWK